MIYNVHNHIETSGFLPKLTEEHLNELIDSSEFLILGVSETIKLEKGGYIITGEIQQKVDPQQSNLLSQATKYSSYTYVPPTANEYSVSVDTKLFKFIHEYKYKTEHIIKDSGE